MRDFFKQLLEKLYPLTGSRQLSMTSADDLPLLLDSMVYACKKYSYIPEDAQQKQIKKQLIEDPEFSTYPNNSHLNARMVNKWLQMISSQYFHEQSHIETNNLLSNAQEVAPPEVAEKYIKMFQENLEKIGKPERQKLTERYEPSFLTKKVFIVEGKEILADTLEEAQELYVTIYLAK